MTAPGPGLTQRQWEGQRPEQLKGSGMGKALQACERFCKEPADLHQQGDYTGAAKALAGFEKAWTRANAKFKSEKRALGREANAVQKLLKNAKAAAESYKKRLAEGLEKFEKCEADKKSLLKGVREAKNRSCTFTVAFKSQTEGQVRIGKKDAEITQMGKKDKRDEGGKQFQGKVTLKAGKMVFDFDGERTVPKSMYKLLLATLKSAGISYKPKVAVAGEEREEEAQA